jgi:exonuclease VII large subunit
MIYIYLLSDDSNNIRYIGQTNNLDRRYRDHINGSLNKNSTTYNTYKSRWIRTLIDKGTKPKMEILSECMTLVESNFEENFWITYLSYLGIRLTNSYHSDVTKFSEETRLKMSLAKRNKSLVEIFGEEAGERIRLNFIERIKNYWTDRPKTEEVKGKISNTLKINLSNKENHWAYGKKFTDEHLEKMRNSHIGKSVGNKNKRTDEQKKVLSNKIKGSTVLRFFIIQKSLSGEFIKKWESLRDIEKFDSTLSRGKIAKCCKGERNKYAGFIWEYGESTTSVVALDDELNIRMEEKSMNSFDSEFVPSSIFISMCNKTKYKGYYFIYKKDLEEFRLNYRKQ